MNRDEAEALLSLLATPYSSMDLIIVDTSGAKITAADVAAALAHQSPMVEAVARYKYAGGSVDSLALRYFAHVLGPLAVKWQRKEPTPSPGFHQQLVRLAADQYLAPTVCLVCNGQIRDYPTSITCAGCKRSGQRKIREKDQLKSLGLKTWGRWRKRYEAICQDLMDADARAVGCMYKHFGGKN